MPKPAESVAPAPSSNGEEWLKTKPGIKWQKGIDTYPHKVEIPKGQKYPTGLKGQINSANNGYVYFKTGTECREYSNTLNPIPSCDVSD